MVPTTRTRRPAVAEAQAVAGWVKIAANGGHDRLLRSYHERGCAPAIQSRAKPDGVTPHAETCLHYLLLTDEAMPRYGRVPKITPPPCSTRDQDALWRATRGFQSHGRATYRPARRGPVLEPVSDPVSGRGS
jgi:dihydroorotase-like cyclic amidohydrolase